MYRFQVKAPTQSGEMIGIVGSIPQFGLWDIKKYLPLQTSGDRYPIWWVDITIDDLKLPDAGGESEYKIEYKYVRIDGKGKVEWESESGANRWVPVESNYISPQKPTLIVDDGAFGSIQPFPYGYLDQAIASIPDKIPNKQNFYDQNGRKVLVIGSSVAMGCSAWLLKGWASHLESALQQKYGHTLINRSQLGANVTSTIERFASVVVPEKPDIVVIALSLGNEGLAYCRPHDRRAVQRRFESGLLQLIKMTQDLGAIPIIGGLYPHGDYTPEHNWLLRDTHARMLQWDVDMLDWLDVLDNGYGNWKSGIWLDVAHPNSLGHKLMFEAIALDLFQKDRLTSISPSLLPNQNKGEIPVYVDKHGFQVFASSSTQTLRIINSSDYSYNITPTWKELQAALRRKAELVFGTYIAKNDELGTVPLLSIGVDGAIENTVTIPSGAKLDYGSALKYFSPKNSEILYYDGYLGILKEGDRTIRIINESDEEYNIHPMWKEIRTALAAMLSGVYIDEANPDVPFRTMMIGDRGLESRVKAPVKSTMVLKYKCKLSEINRIAILPLGDRCAARMLLYKMEYDGPAFPFDLTRSTNLGDVTDLVVNDFKDMWTPAYLHYNSEERRIYHSKWSGLSFAHEVEDSEDPINNMQPIFERMQTRYSARAKRFLYTLNQADEILFVRTGVTNRGYVEDLIEKLKIKCKGKPFRVLLISKQTSDEFVDIPYLLHYDLHFSPDWMYDSLDYWMECTKTMKEILESLGISSQNLFWCPPNP